MAEKRLASMTYKGFTFPWNPETSSIKCDRTYIKHKYPELSGNELEDFGPNACVISGKGIFSGSNAYSLWNRLLAQYNTPGVGSVSHPIFTNITRGLMTTLEASVEPRPNYVEYQFEIVADTTPSINECLGRYVVVTTGSAQASTSSSTPSNTIVHVVSKGECLSVICARYSAKYGVAISWKAVAQANGMKNPDLIYPGDKITISW